MFLTLQYIGLFALEFYRNRCLTAPLNVCAYVLACRTHPFCPGLHVTVL